MLHLVVLIFGQVMYNDRSRTAEVFSCIFQAQLIVLLNVIVVVRIAEHNGENTEIAQVLFMYSGKTLGDHTPQAQIARGDGGMFTA